MFRVEENARASRLEDLGWAGIPALPLTSAVTMGKWPIFSELWFPHLHPGNQTVLPGG